MRDDFQKEFGPLFKALSIGDKAKEKTALNLYNTALKVFEASIGNDVGTYSTTLLKVGKHVWGKKFKGVYSSNSKIPKGYSICNVDAIGEPGSHWLAICDGVIYDSFGRTIKPLAKDLSRFKDVDLDAEQSKKENNCGARSLAFIFVYDTLGEEYAKLI